MQRIAPNNQYPATEYVEVYDFKEYDYCECSENPLPIAGLKYSLAITNNLHGKTVAVFFIRPNRIPTKHNFNK